MGVKKAFLILITVFLLSQLAAACSDGICKVGDECSSDADCEVGLYCFPCAAAFSGSKCVRSTATNPFLSLNNSLPLSMYAFLTTHNAYAIDDGTTRLTLTNQEDNVTQQLNNGFRALILDTYDFKGDIWLCHSFQGQCQDYTAFEPAINTLREVEAFLSSNPTEIVVLILEDYVRTPNGLTKVFKDAGLMKYWFPLSKLPKNGQNWPSVSDTVANNERLLVFTSLKSKENSERIAYQWNYMVENQYGDDGMKTGNCSNRAESSALNDPSKSLVLVNYFRSIPAESLACVQNSGGLADMLRTCYGAAGNRSEGGGIFQATDILNGELLCGCKDVHSCLQGSSCASP